MPSLTDVTQKAIGGHGMDGSLREAPIWYPSKNHKCALWCLECRPCFFYSHICWALSSSLILVTPIFKKKHIAAKESRKETNFNFGKSGICAKELNSRIGWGKITFLQNWAKYHCTAPSYAAKVKDGKAWKYFLLHPNWICRKSKSPVFLYYGKHLGGILLFWRLVWLGKQYYSTKSPLPLPPQKQDKGSLVHCALPQVIWTHPLYQL